MQTILNNLGKAKEEGIRIASDAQTFLQANGRRPVSEGSETIRMALFGQYNAGKSTIVNALLGERVAVTGDSPKTKVLHVYTIKGFEIADLPGGDARLQECEEAHGALKSAHAVLYVVSSATGLDYATTWEDLKLLVSRGIPFLVVVNDKKPHQDEASERESRHELERCFHEHATRNLPGQDWGNRYFWVIAKQAERGRLEMKETLVKKSGIVPFEHALTAILRESNAIMHEASYLRALQAELRSLIELLESSIETVEFKGVESALQRCDIARDRLDAAANMIAEDSFAPLQRGISAIYYRAYSSKAGFGIEEELTTLIQSTYENACASFSSRCQSELCDIGTFVEHEIKYKSPEKSDIKFNLGQVPKSEGEKVDLNAIARRIAAAVANLRDASGGAKTAIAAGAAKTAAVQGGRAVATEGLKSSATAVAETGGQTVAKESAKNAGKIIGPVIIIAIAGYEIWEGYRSAQRELKREEVAAKEAEAKAELAARTCRHQFLALASAVVADNLAPFEKDLRKELKSHTRSKNDILAKIVTARDLSTRLDAVIRLLAGSIAL